MISIKAYNHRLLPLLVIFVIAGAISSAAAEKMASPGKGLNLGAVGATYEISEPDALLEIEERAKQVNWDKVFEKNKMEEMVRTYRPSDLRPLPRVTATRVYSVDMTYTLTQDIPDGRGGVLYPNGFSFNPLQHLSLPNVLVFIDGSDPDQIAWFAASPYAKDKRATLLLTEGDYYDLMKKFRRPTYYATKNILSRMNVTAVPAVAVQKGSMIEVHEIEVPIEKNKK